MKYTPGGWAGAAGAGAAIGAALRFSEVVCGVPCSKLYRGSLSTYHSVNSRMQREREDWLCSRPPWSHQLLAGALHFELEGGGAAPPAPRKQSIFQAQGHITSNQADVCCVCSAPPAPLPHSLSHLPPAPPLQPPSKAQQHTWSSWGARVDGCAGSSLLPAVARCSASPSTSNRCSSVLGMGMEEGLS
jgi:hypothetical protein